MPTAETKALSSSMQALVQGLQNPETRAFTTRWWSQFPLVVHVKDGLVTEVSVSVGGEHLVFSRWDLLCMSKQLFSYSKLLPSSIDLVDEIMMKARPYVSTPDSLVRDLQNPEIKDYATRWWSRFPLTVHVEDGVVTEVSVWASEKSTTKFSRLDLLRMSKGMFRASPLIPNATGLIDEIMREARANAVTPESIVHDLQTPEVKDYAARGWSRFSLTVHVEGGVVTGVSVPLGDERSVDLGRSDLLHLSKGLFRSMPLLPDNVDLVDEIMEIARDQVEGEGGGGGDGGMGATSDA